MKISMNIALKEVDGVGSLTLENYGQDRLKLIANFDNGASMEAPVSLRDLQLALSDHEYKNITFYGNLEKIVRDLDKVSFYFVFETYSKPISVNSDELIKVLNLIDLLVDEVSRINKGRF